MIKRVILVAACLVLGLGPVRARAELVQVPSVEWMAADADLIIRGTITSFSTATAESAAPPGRVTLHVIERWPAVLDGPTEVVFPVNPLVAEPNHLDGLQTSGDEVLVFLVRGERRADDGYPADGWAPRAWSMAEWLVPLNGSADRMDCSFAVGAEAIRAVIETSVAVPRPPGPPVAHVLECPFETPVFGRYYSGSGVDVVVPVDERLSSLAAEWRASSDDEWRMAGVEALRPFQSPESEAMLRELLADPVSFEWIDGADGTRYRTYPFRRTAVRILSGWGIDVSSAVFDEPVSP